MTGRFRRNGRFMEKSGGLGEGALPLATCLMRRLPGGPANGVLNFDTTGVDTILETCALFKSI